jgi:Ca2+-binding EF-hand superfamily protein
VGYLFSISVFSLNYFPLEGVLAERLFATFDKDKNNVIDYEEFLGELLLSTVHNTFL